MKRMLILCFLVFAGLCFSPGAAHACSTEVECYAIAKTGDAEGQYQLGLIYFNGQGVPKNYTEAQEWFRKAAKQGHVEAQYILGYMYVNNLGVPIEYDKAMAPYMRSFQKGYGDLYNRETITAYLSAAKRYDAIIQQGYEDAMSGRNTRYTNKIIRWVQKVFNLGLKDVLKNYKEAMEKLQAGNYAEALKWFQLAAKKGNPGAQYQLGLMYAKGQGVKQDYVEAYAWVAIAAAQGDREADKALNQIAEKLSPGQLARAEVLAKKYYKRYVAPYL